MRSYSRRSRARAACKTPSAYSIKASLTPSRDFGPVRRLRFTSSISASMTTGDCTSNKSNIKTVVSTRRHATRIWCLLKASLMCCFSTMRGQRGTAQRVPASKCLVNVFSQPATAAPRSGRAVALLPDKPPQHVLIGRPDKSRQIANRPEVGFGDPSRASRRTRRVMACFRPCHAHRNRG